MIHRLEILDAALLALVCVLNGQVTKGSLK